MWKFCQKMNFVSTPWKIIIALGNSVGDHIWVIQIYMGEVMIFFYTKVTIFENLMKKIDSSLSS